jgi:hypothetical protein
MDMSIMHCVKQFKAGIGVNEKRLPFQAVPSFFTTN